MGRVASSARSVRASTCCAATMHWCHAADFAVRFPAVRIDAERLIVDDGDIITAGAVMAWTDLGLRIVNRLLGPTVTVATARYMLFDPAGREQRHYSGFAPPPNHGDASVLRVQHWLQANGARHVTLAAMAERAGLEQCTLLRRFHQATGLRPTEDGQHLRIAHAREMLELSARSVAQIAWQVGYGDETAFRRYSVRSSGCLRGLPASLSYGTSGRTGRRRTASTRPRRRSPDRICRSGWLKGSPGQCRRHSILVRPAMVEASPSREERAGPTPALIWT
jgi:AraC-like DNA-binding protein